MLLTNPHTCVIDASTAHRTVPGWTFGMPELAPEQRDAIRCAKRIANPGCHASAFILLMRPLIDAGLVAADTPLGATSITGYSGGGKSMIEQYESGPNPLLDAPRPYALGLAHKHLPEMTRYTGLAEAPVFMPVVGRFSQGLAVSVPLHVNQLQGRADGASLHQALVDRYAGERFMRVMPLSDPDTLASGFFDVQACNGTNRVDLFVFANATQVVLMARLDNLGKGASGAAVQSMNVHLGLDEGLGL
jgi:N-acetyl-gamma-glutamyl-phosphate reductase